MNFVIQNEDSLEKTEREIQAVWKRQRPCRKVEATKALDSKLPPFARYLLHISESSGSDFRFNL